MELIHEDQAPAIAQLETRLVEFYNTFTGYDAFNDPPEYPVLWGEVLRLARAGTAHPCRVLEIGAGRSGFGKYLLAQGARGKVRLTSQDITTANVAHLRASSDEVITGNIDRLEGSWDLIFHSYVYEHLCRPREFNERLWSLLSPGGHLIIQCPRYDFPLYFPPCWDHLPLVAKLWQTLRLAGNDLAAACGHEASRFTVFADPAVFHLPFVRDRDAVHRVRKSDLRWLFGGRANLREFDLAPGSLEDWIVKKFFTLRVIVRKNA